MYERMIDLTKPNPHLPHNSAEIEGKPPADAANEELALRNADLLISQLMQEEHKGAPKLVERQYHAA